MSIDIDCKLPEYLSTHLRYQSNGNHDLPEDNFQLIKGNCWLEHPVMYSRKENTTQLD